MKVCFFGDFLFYFYFKRPQTRRRSLRWGHLAPSGLLSRSESCTTSKPAKLKFNFSLNSFRWQTKQREFAWHTASTSSPLCPHSCGQMWSVALRKADRDSRRSAINFDRRDRNAAAVDISWINRIFKWAGIIDMLMRRPFWDIPWAAKAGRFHNVLLTMLQTFSFIIVLIISKKRDGFEKPSERALG